MGNGGEANGEREIDKTRSQSKITHNRKTIQARMAPLSEIKSEQVKIETNQKIERMLSSRPLVTSTEM